MMINTEIAALARARARTLAPSQRFSEVQEVKSSRQTRNSRRTFFFVVPPKHLLSRAKRAPGGVIEAAE